MPPPLLSGENHQTLTWVLGNTFALAVWWVLSGVVSGVFLALFGGTLTQLLAGKPHGEARVERRVGMVGGALVGLSGGATVGVISDFGGLLGLIYLWGFVAMTYAAFLGVHDQWRRPGPGGDDGDPVRSAREERLAPILERLSNAFSTVRPGNNWADEFQGILLGGAGGALYGAVTGFLIPLSAATAAGDPAQTVFAAAVIWMVLGGFGGWVGGRRIGPSGGLVTLAVSLLIGSSLGALIALFGQVFGDVVSGAINGAIGGAFFGGAAAAELIHKRYA
jgi:hypothetical protein